MSEVFRILAASCGSCGCGCPTIMEADNDAVVVVGSATDPLLEAAAVKGKTGDGEAAIVIPKRLLIEAMLALGL
jgi:hypothetical protein